MAVVQRLVKQLPDQVVFSRGANAGAVQRMIRRGSGVGVAKLDEKLAQLGSRETGPDDRTMQRRRDVPDPGPAALGIGHHQRRRVVPPAKQQDAAPRMVIAVDDGQVGHRIFQTL
jgi:hypothetical protein